MTDLSLPYLYESVRATFQARRGLEISFAFGWKEPPRQPQTGVAKRIVFVPGDDSSGDLGKITPPVRPGRFPRPIGTLRELFTVYVWGYDPVGRGVSGTELAQFRAARLLYDEFFAALYRAAYGRFAVESQRWNHKGNVESRLGAEIRMVCIFEAELPDLVDDVENTTGVHAAGEAAIELPTGTVPGAPFNSQNED